MRSPRELRLRRAAVQLKQQQLAPSSRLPVPPCSIVPCSPPDRRWPSPKTLPLQKALPPLPTLGHWLAERASKPPWQEQPRRLGSAGGRAANPRGGGAPGVLSRRVG